jgi:50S ribosomal protein L16 3-hydroxylase
MTELQWPVGLDPEDFVRYHWQQCPLLLRQAFPAFQSPLEPDDLAGLACDETIESRIVLGQGKNLWELRNGPFKDDDFARLPATHWTLLVQDVDKAVPEVAELLQSFRFLPDWRVDDVMVSFAPDGGSVGPHYDEYDVFLIQGQGQRRWQIHSRPVSDADCMPDSELRILRRFDAEQEWLLAPGDMLYLPPGVAHWGTAVGDCMTYSIGFRAPSWRELMIAYCEELIARVPDDRYRDRDLSGSLDSAEIPPAARNHIVSTLSSYLNPEIPDFGRWFGRFITEPKPHLAVEPKEEAIAPSVLRTLFEQQGRLVRHGHSRMAFSCEPDGKVYLYANGVDFGLSGLHSEFVRVLTQRRHPRHDELRGWLNTPECLDLLTTLFNEGHYGIPDDADRV